MEAVPKEIYLGLDGRVALVTQAAGEVGQTIAWWLARAGCDLALVDPDAARVEALAESLRDESITAMAFESASNGGDDLGDLVDRILGDFGTLEIAVSILDGPPEAERLGGFCAGLGRVMAAAGEGGSLLLVWPEEKPDPAALTALHAATRRAALDGRGDRIRVNAIVGGRAGDLGRSGVTLVSDLGASVTGQLIRADAGAHLDASPDP